MNGEVRCTHTIRKLLLVLLTASAGATHAAKPGGGGGTPPPPGGACVGKGGVFPAMAYSRGVFSKNGTYTKTQIFVANSLGTCEVMVWDTADYDGYPIEPAFHFDFSGVTSGTGTLVWTQTRDNGETPEIDDPSSKSCNFRCRAAQSLDFRFRRSRPIERPIPRDF